MLRSDKHLDGFTLGAKDGAIGHVVSWSEAIVGVTVDRQAIKAAPPYVGDTTLNRDDEAPLYRQYGRDAYWSAPTARAVAWAASATLEPGA